LKPISSKPNIASLPKIGGIEDDEDMDQVMEDADVEETLWEVLEIKDMLGEELITMSQTAKSKWKTLVNLDVIRERNKPEKPPEAPKAAPFILPMAPGIEPRFIAVDKDDEPQEIKSRIINTTDKVIQSRFIKLLSDSEKSGDHTEVINDLQKMSPSAIDFEIRALSYNNNFEELKLILTFIRNQMAQKKNFDLYEALLNITLKLHMDIIPTQEVLVNLCSEIENIQNQSWSELLELMDHSLCLMSFFSNTFDNL